MKTYTIRLENDLETILEKTVNWEYIPSYIFHDDSVYASGPMYDNGTIVYVYAGNALQIP